MQSASTLAAAIVLFGGLAACRGGDRNTATADSAVVHASGRGDSAGAYKTQLPPDSVGQTSPAGPAFPNPASILAADSSAGLRTYRLAAGCIGCHGGRAEGVQGLGSPLVDAEWQRGDGSLSFLYAIIRDGVSDPANTRNAMPGAGDRFSPREVFQIAAYVYSLSHPGSTVPDSASLRAGAPPLARPPADTTRF